MDAMDEKKMQAYDTIEKVKADLYATKVSKISCCREGEQ